MMRYLATAAVLALASCSTARASSTDNQVTLSNYCIPNDGLNDSVCIASAMSAVKTAGVCGEVIVNGTYDFTAKITPRSCVFFRFTEGSKFVKRFVTVGDHSLFDMFGAQWWGVFGGRIESAVGSTGKLATFCCNSITIDGTTFDNAAGGGFTVTLAGGGILMQNFTVISQPGYGHDGIHPLFGHGFIIRDGSIIAGDDCIGVSGAYHQKKDEPIENGLIENIVCDSDKARAVHIGIADWANNTGYVRNWTIRNVTGKSGDGDHVPAIAVQDESDIGRVYGIHIENSTIDSSLSNIYGWKNLKAHQITTSNVEVTDTAMPFLYQEGTTATNYNLEIPLSWLADSRIGSIGNDTMVGDGAAQLIIGAEGNDSISGLGGGDYLIGGYGNDTIRSASASDVMRGGPGNDTFYVYPGATIADFNAGEDTRIDL